MFTVEIEQSKNLLKISYSGRVGVEDVTGCEQQVLQVLPELKPGFRLLTDMTGLELMEHACLPYIRRVMDECNAKGIALVVRVISDPRKDIGLNILSLFHYHRRVKIVTCETVEEAVRILA